MALNTYCRIHVDSRKGTTPDPDKLDGAVAVVVQLVCSPARTTWRERRWKRFKRRLSLSKSLTETFLWKGKETSTSEIQR